MSTVSVSTELPISAEEAWRLAQKPEMFEYVLAPIIRMTGLNLPERLEASASGWRGCGCSASSPRGPTT